MDFRATISASGEKKHVAKLETRGFQVSVSRSACRARDRPPKVQEIAACGWILWDKKRFNRFFHMENHRKSIKITFCLQTSAIPRLFWSATGSLGGPRGVPGAILAYFGMYFWSVFDHVWLFLLVNLFHVHYFHAKTKTFMQNH